MGAAQSPASDVIGAGVWERLFSNARERATQGQFRGKWCAKRLAL